MLTAEQIAKIAERVLKEPVSEFVPMAGPSRRITPMTPIECVQVLANVPDPEDLHSQLDISLVQPCRDFKGTEEEAIRLLRDTLDKIARYGAGTSFIMKLIHIALLPFPESEESKKQRRAEIEAKE